jgi:hypothetical protein
MNELRIAAQAGLDRLNSVVVHWGLRKSDNAVNSTVGDIFTTIAQLESALAQPVYNGDKKDYGSF